MGPLFRLWVARGSAPPPGKAIVNRGMRGGGETIDPHPGSRDAAPYGANGLGQAWSRELPHGLLARANDVGPAGSLHNTRLALFKDGVGLSDASGALRECPYYGA